MNSMKDARLNGDGLVLADRYAETMRDLVLPSLQKQRKELTIRGYEGKPLAVSRFDAENPKGTVTIVHGFTSAEGKYSELVFSLLQYAAIITLLFFSFDFLGFDTRALLASVS